MDELIAGWAEYPPLGVLVKAIVQGLGGKPSAAPSITSDNVLNELAAKAGRALPVIRGKDSGLPKAKPVFDFELLRKKNLERNIKAIRVKNG